MLYERIFRSGFLVTDFVFGSVNLVSNKRVMLEFDSQEMFGKSLKAWRNRRGISREKLADLSDLHRTCIADVESIHNILLQAEKNQISLRTMGHWLNTARFGGTFPFDE